MDCRLPFVFMAWLAAGQGFTSAAAQVSSEPCSGGSSMSPTSKTSGASGSEKPTPPDDNNVVITPAGPVPRDRVRRVDPNEVVRRNEDGSQTVVPKGETR
jgi:hypothetical protein